MTCTTIMAVKMFIAISFRPSLNPENTRDFN